MTGCRISRVRFKNGADMRILPDRKVSDATHVLSAGVQHAAHHDTLAAGYFVVRKDGGTRCGWFYSSQKDGIGGAQMLVQDIYEGMER